MNNNKNKAGAVGIIRNGSMHAIITCSINLSEKLLYSVLDNNVSIPKDAIVPIISPVVTIIIITEKLSCPPSKNIN
ncbi:hypothetical protein H0266_14835 [Halobacillus locisalis]|uniref:Uncharacterized protein n=1 Tax=Halobacillus locisalis TaxID=220753 RepID=A0A838CW28_9BACI|nr:hypothetical protein [Halobacillus locisalis]MBA2176170.1 hypothetical protein [Halobacillus locisalis]